MIDRRSMVTQFGWRLGVALTIVGLVELAWLFLHFKGTDILYKPGGLLHALLDFLGDVAWIIPVNGVVTLIVCSVGLRSMVAPLKLISEQASRIEPGHKHTPLSLENVPSEIKPLVASVNIGFDRLVGAVEVQRRFTANAAHSLRTTLAILQVGLERLPEGAEVTALRQEVRRTGRIVSQMLSLARLEGSNDNGIVALDLINAVRGVLDTLAPLASGSQVILAFENELERLPVLATAESLEEVVRNLVENAIAHAPSASEVTVRVAADGTLTVSDHGPGIPEADQTHVFERFWRGKRASIQGSGLGLAIVAEASQRIGAKVTCVPQKSSGAKFAIRFKVAQ